MSDTSTEEQNVDAEEQVVHRRKRRTRAEIEADNAARAASALSDNTPPTSPLPAPVPQKLTPLEAIAVLASQQINPAEYSDLYNLMKDCIRVKREYNLSDTRFMELMNRFDDRVGNDEDDVKGRRRR